MRYKVDASRSTYLGLCRCGQRFLALTRERALERLADHEAVHHPGERHARNGLDGLRKRHAEKSTTNPGQ